MKKILTAFAIFASLVSLHALEEWDGSVSSDFTDVNNWGFASPPATLSGEDLTHDGNGGNAPVFSTGSLSIGFYRFGNSSFGVNSTTNLTLNGGDLTTSNDFEVLTGRENHQATVDISNGSVLDIGGFNLDNINNNGSITSSTFDINVLSGGTLQRVSQIRGDSDVNVSGGTFRVGSTEGSASSTNFAGSASWVNNDSNFSLTGTGQVVFDIFGVGSADSFTSNAGPGYSLSLDLTGGSVVLALDSAYSPTVGDSFSLINFSGSGFVDYVTLSAANVQNSLITGGVNAGELVQWDTSAWQTSGVLSVGAIVPEPSTALLLGISSLMFLVRRRRH